MNRQQLLEAYAKLRVADVRDGLDRLGYHAFCSVDPAIRPLWPTRVCGIARTVRYLPFRGPAPTERTEAYDAWSGMYYSKINPYPWTKAIQPGDFVIIDQSGVDAGLMGSENTLACMRKGAVGFVSNGAVRDTDEVIAQQVPFWSAFRSQKMVQTRIQYEAMDVAVAIGGVTVCPGDVVCADGDGVIVVPSEVAAPVAAYGLEERTRDMAARAKHYHALGMKADASVGNSPG